MDSKATKQTAIINMYGGAGAGKTAAAWQIASELKRHGLVVEYVPEYAKELVWDEDYATLGNQELVFAEQSRRIERLIGKVDYIVTDSPLLLNVIYGKQITLDFNEQILQTVHSHPNLNFFIQRGEGYEQEGRIHTLVEAKAIDQQILDTLTGQKIPFEKVTQRSCRDAVLSHILPKDPVRKTIYVCSPLSGEIEANIRKAREYSRFVAQQGATPIAPHITELFDDAVPEEREMGLEMGLNYLRKADELWVFGKTISNGMAAEIKLAQEELHIPVFQVDAPPFKAKPYAEFIKQKEEAEKMPIESINDYANLLPENSQEAFKGGYYGIDLTGGNIPVNNETREAYKLGQAVRRMESSLPDIDAENTPLTLFFNGINSGHYPEKYYTSIDFINAITQIQELEKLEYNLQLNADYYEDELGSDFGFDTESRDILHRRKICKQELDKANQLYKSYIEGNPILVTHLSAESINALTAPIAQGDGFTVVTNLKPGENRVRINYQDAEGSERKLYLSGEGLDVDFNQMDSDALIRFAQPYYENAFNTPFFGKIEFLGSGGIIGETLYYGSRKDYLQEIHDSQEVGRPIHAKEITQEEYQEGLWESYQVSIEPSQLPLENQLSLIFDDGDRIDVPGSDWNVDFQSMTTTEQRNFVQSYFEDIQYVNAWRNSLVSGLPQHIGYSILGENSQIAVGYNPFEPEKLVIWSKGSDGSYINGRYRNGLRHEEWDDLQADGLNTEEIKQLLKSAKYFDYNRLEHTEALEEETEMAIKPKTELQAAPRAPRTQKMPKNFTGEQLLRAKEVDLLGYLESHGYTVRPHGSAYKVVLGEHDSDVVFPDTNSWYSYKTGEGRDIVDWLVKKEGKSMVQAVQELTGETFDPQKLFKREKQTQAPTPAKKLQLPERCNNNNNTLDYLIKERKLNAALVTRFVKEGLIYQGKTSTKKGDKTYSFENCVFVNKDENGNAKGAMLRSMKDNQHVFKGNATGTDRDYGFVLPGKTHAKWLTLCESPIEALSLASLHMLRGEPWDDEHYLCLNGITDSGKDNDLAHRIIQRFLDNHPDIETINIAFNNDKDARNADGTPAPNHGKIVGALVRNDFDSRFTVLESYPERKDYNLELQHAVEQENRPQVALPEKAPNNKRTFMHLTGTKQLNRDLVNEWIADQKLYQSDMVKNINGKDVTLSNAVFVQKDESGEPVYAISVNHNQDMNRPDFERDYCNARGRDNYIQQPGNNTTLMVFNNPVSMLTHQSYLREHNEIPQNHYLCCIHDPASAVAAYLKQHPEVEEVKVMLDPSKAMDSKTNQLIDYREKMFERILSKVESRHTRVGRKYPKSIDLNRDMAAMKAQSAQKQAEKEGAPTDKGMETGPEIND